jgi:hypothetical protein
MINGQLIYNIKLMRHKVGNIVWC